MSDLVAMPNRVATIGFEIPGADTTDLAFRSDSSLLDFDIIVVNPSMSGMYGNYDDYLGKPSLSDLRSFQLKEQLEHWRQEINAVLMASKTVFVFLNSVQEAYVATGEKSFSGTGRNRQATRHVELCNNYQCIPGGLKARSSKGSAMRLDGNANPLASYWADFEDLSEYRVILDDNAGHKLVVTKSGGRTVGKRYRFKEHSGAMYFLPYIDFYDDSFMYEEEDQVLWTDEAISLGKKLVGDLVAISKAGRRASDVAPTPTWLDDNAAFALPAETKLGGDLLKIETRIEELNQDKERLQSEIANEISLKRLLYENGRPLEAAIMSALEILGFEASHYRDSDSEFDVVFECEEGRLLGEAEGRDSKQISIDKLRQLEMNIHEDLARDEVSEPAKAVLFGNAYRTLAPDEREPFFTDKCVSAAKRSQTALVRTTDLFIAARHLKFRRNARYAKKVRRAILGQTGLVVFPKIAEGSES